MGGSRLDFGLAVFQAVKHHQEQIEEARRLHHQDLKASVSLHNHEIEVENKMHRQEVKLACKLHDREKEMALAMHNIALQVRAKPTPQNPLLPLSCHHKRPGARADLVLFFPSTYHLYLPHEGRAPPRLV